ncbi:hypothetical protein B0G74_9130 [Paraburkholderia sp. BL9I2N2]|nr:hypothetical protein B0G74_9130 [Paraburkholderia sp. BL9I2N2]
MLDVPRSLAYIRSSAYDEYTFVPCLDKNCIAGLLTLAWPHLYPVRVTMSRNARDLVQLASRRSDVDGSDQRLLRGT